MKSNLFMDFVVDKENHQINIKREFAASLDLVWAAYTQSELLDQWWAPKPWKARTKTMDFREGGHWHYAMVGPEGEEHWARADYEKIEKLKNFAAKDAFADKEGAINPALPDSYWEVGFSKEGNHTLVTNKITFDDLAQLETTIEMGFKEGITLAMEGLDELLAKI